MNLINLIDLCKVYNLPDPLSGIKLPAPLDADACRSAILIRCGMLEPVYYEPEVFTQIFASWFAMRDWNFKHLLAIVQAEYSPIENTDRYSEKTTKRTGKDGTTHSGSDVTQMSGTDTEIRTPNLTESRTDEISAENVSTYQSDSKHTTTEQGSETKEVDHGKTETTTHGLTENKTYDGNETYSEHTHGNIGVTSNVTLITEELDLIRRFNVYEWIAERIEEEFFVQVY